MIERENLTEKENVTEKENLAEQENLTDRMNLQKERYELAADRIREICQEEAAPPFGEFFKRTADFLQQMIQLREEIARGTYSACPLEELRRKNRELYQDVLPENYGKSYGNPAYAARILGSDYGPLFSFLYTELQGMIPFAFEEKDWDMLVGMELFLQVYGEFENGGIPSPETVQKILYWYVNDYCGEMIESRLQENVDPSQNFFVHKILTSDLTDLRYLYEFGEYVTSQEEKMAAFLNTFEEEEIRAMARTYTEGYRVGFQITGKDISKKKTVCIQYRLGFERMIREAILQFEQMGLKTTIYRSAAHSVNKRQHFRNGFYGAVPNPQFDYDHRNDAGIYLDEDFVSRKLRAMRNAYEAYKDLAALYGGPAVVDVFGEAPFVPQPCKEGMTLTEKQQKLQVRLNSESSQITNRYIKGEERSFTIIAYPVPEIGGQFEEIFRETVKINTLDYNLYQTIQQKMIDALDEGVCVRIQGKDGNETDMCIRLHPLTDPSRQSNFENCVADVNIPVGEVFTSPVLTGTRGTLHVKKVYLEGLQYQDLRLQFEDGRVVSYGCGNFETEEENRAYIEENILHRHMGLPIGEFAIGTNTMAYRMASRFGIEEKLPILIAEKTGPHFAVGDTCYCWSEDTVVYNPNGKEIIARDNEVSVLRKEDPGKAYFNCHTDITIPYDELGGIWAERADGSRIDIIRDGRFVLPGTEELNKPLAE